VIAVRPDSRAIPPGHSDRDEATGDRQAHDNGKAASGVTAPIRSRVQEVEAALARCAEGYGALVWVAEPGMGKSALLASAAHHVAQSGALVINVPVSRPDGDHGSGPTAMDAIVGQLTAHTRANAVPDRRATVTMPGVPRQPATARDDALSRRTLSDLAAAVAPERTIVFVADDLDLVDPITRSAVTGTVLERRTCAVLLATATDAHVLECLPHDVERREVLPIDALDALELLWSTRGEPVAPHVAQLLVSQLAGAPGAVVETAQLLTPDQLAGLSLIPDPLPVATSVRRAVSGVFTDLPDPVRRFLLVAAVSVVDATDVLLRATDTDIDALVACSEVRHLEMVAGHVRITDPRVRAVVHDEASMCERTEAHQRLAAVHAADGSTVLATWHTALAALAGEPALARRLMATARTMLAQGQAVWAQRVAKEAASHATGTCLAEAIGLAGRTALHAGHLVDAADLLREATRIGDPETATSLRMPFLVAGSLAAGQVPHDLTDREGTTLEHVAAAVLHAERGDMTTAAQLIATSREQARTDEERDAVLLGRRVLDLFAGSLDEVVAMEPAADDNATRAAMVCTLRGLALAADDRIDEARGVLAAALAERAPLPAGRTPAAVAWANESTPGVEALTPLVEARVRLADALVEAWAGNIEGAAATLTLASFRLPMALCLGSTGAVLAGRLGALRHGTTGVLAEALERLVPLRTPPSVRTGLLGNHALCMLLLDQQQNAATLFGLSEEAPGVSPLPIPGLRYAEAKVLLTEANADVPPCYAPRGGEAADGGLCVGSVKATADEARLEAAVGDGDIDALVSRALDAARSLRSPFERGQTRLVVGRALVLHGRVEDGADHLRAAAGLFEECGAHAMAGLATRLLDDALTVRMLDAAATGVGAGREAAGRPRAVGRGEAAERPRAAQGREAAERPEPNGPSVAPADDVGTAEDADGARGNAPAHDEHGTDWAASLTEREREVARVIAAGASNRAAAHRLHISTRTIEVHLTNVFRKVGVSSRMELALLVNRAERGA
jgi:DNA-binding CsgD family transcriptional regulator